MSEFGTSKDNWRQTLKADCSNCFGLCCVALAFAKSADFPMDKAAGEPCANLKDDFRCGIHSHLRESGFKGCTVFECFGAGQKVSRETFNGQSWKQAPETSQQMFTVFPIMRQLHELLWYLNEAMAMPETDPIHDELTRAIYETEQLTVQDPEAIMRIDLESHQDLVSAALSKTSKLTRAESRQVQEAKGLPRIHRGAD